MQYKLLAFSAFAATALAQNSTTSSENLVSVLSVLQTALPSSLVAEALTNSAAVSSEIASEFSAGHTPSWFTGLPTDIQTFLVPVATGVSSLNGTGIANGTALHNSTTSAKSSLTQSTVAVTSNGASSSAAASSIAAGSSAAQAGASSSSSGGASMPTAIMGAGLAGAVGLVGLLAL